MRLLIVNMKVAFASGDCNSTNFAWKYDRDIKTLFQNPNQLSRVEEELAEGLAKIFSTQLELGEAELQSKLLQDAEIKALQAQINPHFLFNAINTVSALCRTDVEKQGSYYYSLAYISVVICKWHVSY